MSRLDPVLARAVDDADRLFQSEKGECDEVLPRRHGLPAQGTRQNRPEASSVALDPATLDLAALSGLTPPPRRFAWEPGIPAGTVTLLHGYGGVGKSLLAQQVATHFVAGIPLFGGEMGGGPALVLAGEDEHDELWRRQLAICQRLDLGLDALAGRLILVAAPHIDITLAVAGESGVVQPTAMLDATRALVERHRPGLVVLDNPAKLFAVKEGDRIAVTRCVGMLQSICHDYATSVLLLAHNNKLGEFSGSTAWENACRSRLSLTRDAGDETLTLARDKANYAALGDIKLRWDKGVFRCEEETFMTEGERIAAVQEKRQHAIVFLAALDTLTEQGRAVSHSRQAQNYAPKAMLAAKLVGDLTKKQLAVAMELLFAEGRIEANAKVGQRKQRSPQYGIVRTNQCED